jgi:DNA polymerase-3 subunit delta'
MQMKFSEIVGQHALGLSLVESVSAGRIAHAQLFSGEPGAGVLPLALAYIQFLNCTDRRGNDSCGECPSCVKIGALAHPDLHFVFPTNAPKGWSSSQKPTSDTFLPQWRELVAQTRGYFDEHELYDAIGMENQQGNIAKREADEIIRKLSFKSFEARWKCILMWLPEKMGDEAANTLLKILEEPWERTVFLLVAEKPEKLPSTILSRTQQIAVPGIGAADLERYAVERLGIPEEQARMAARMAAGSLIELRRLVSADSQEIVRENFEYFAQLMRYSYGDRHLDLFGWAETMAGLGRESQKRFLEYSSAMLRESYMLAAGLDDISYLWGGEMDFCRKFAPYITSGNIESLIEENRLASLHIAQNGNPKIIFTHYALTVSTMINRT